MPEPATITLPWSRFQDLCDSERKLAALEAGGVDNWEGYSEALRGFYDEEDDDA
jgi:hypothetical protein